MTETPNIQQLRKAYVKMLNEYKAGKPETATVEATPSTTEEVVEYSQLPKTKAQIREEKAAAEKAKREAREQMETEVRDRVASKVLDLVVNRQAIVEEELYKALAPIPKSVVIEVLKLMRERGMIRRTRTAKNGMILIALAATPQARVTMAALRQIALDKQGRKNFFNDESENKRKVALTPYADDEIHYSENAEFGDSFTQALNADFDDAVTLSATQKLPNRPNLHPVQLTEAKKALVERQIATGQGKRNAARAEARKEGAELRALARAGIINIHALKEVKKEETRKLERKLFGNEPISVGPTTQEMPESSPEFDDACNVG